jgi:hypothetical protein
MDTLMKQKVFASFDGNGSRTELTALCTELLENQKYSWPDLSLGYAALEQVRVKKLHCDGFSVRLHHNPARIKSTIAPVDKASVNERPCFLCLENLPEGQRGVLYRNDFIVLCNPFPITSHHYTVAHVNHTPQSFEGTAAMFLKMTKDFHPDFNVFYNGPESGASAPDHLHFQAAPRGVLPIEKEIHGSARRIFMKRGDGVSLYNVEHVGRGVVILEGENADAVSAALLSVISAMKNVLSSENEPKMNLLGSHNGEQWQVVIFPRRKHRPRVYFLTENERVLISPGLVEMGGIVVTPIAKDFDTVDHTLVQEIYREVSVDAETVQNIIEAVAL